MVTRHMPSVLAQARSIPPSARKPLVVRCGIVRPLLANEVSVTFQMEKSSFSRSGAWQRVPMAAAFAVGLSIVACGNSSSGGGAGGASNSGGNAAGGSSAGTAGSGVGTAGSSTSSAGTTSSGGSSVAGSNSAAGGGGSPVGGGGASASGGTAGRAAGGGSSQAGAAGAASGEPPSCAPGGPGMNTCGADGKESCCISLPVTGGTFNRTYTNTGSGATAQADPATVSSFRLDKYELSVGRLRQYVNYLVAGGALPAAGSGKHSHLNAGKGLADSGKSGSFEPGWDASWNSNLPAGAGAAATWAKNLDCGVSASERYGTFTAAAGANEMLPVTCMDWYEAHAFCIWDGGFLPSEAEWKYAAAGGDEQRMYPWGSTAPGTANQYANYDCYYPSGTAGNCTGVVNIAKVGYATLGGGRWGQLDLSGSVWEWDLDVYAAKFSSPCTDCALLSGGTNRVLPGGGFHTALMPYLLSSNQTTLEYPTTYRGNYGVGVRCARTP